MAIESDVQVVDFAGEKPNRVLTEHAIEQSRRATVVIYSSKHDGEAYLSPRHQYTGFIFRGDLGEGWIVHILSRESMAMPAIMQWRQNSDLRGPEVCRIMLRAVATQMSSVVVYGATTFGFGQACRDLGLDFRGLKRPRIH